MLVDKSYKATPAIRVKREKDVTGTNNTTSDDARTAGTRRVLASGGTRLALFDTTSLVHHWDTVVHLGI